MTTSSLFWDGALILPSGEVSPGIRTPVIQGMVLSKKEGFGWLNYSVLGGIEAVIWTDVIQVVVLLGGALVSLVLMVFSMDLSWGELAAFVQEDNKMRLFDTSLYPIAKWGFRPVDCSGFCSGHV